MTSTAYSITRQVLKRGLKRILVGTTRAAVLPYLQPDFVVFSLSGRLCINPIQERKLQLTFDFKPGHAFHQGALRALACLLGARRGSLTLRRGHDAGPPKRAPVSR